MKKKSLLISLFLFVALALGACSSLQLGSSNTAASSSTDPNQAAASRLDPAKMPVESKLGIGILKLEGTSNAVTAQQAKDLLPLWKAVKSITTASTTSPEEVTALYKQIEDTLTPAQVDAIKNLTWTQEDLRALMQKEGVQFGAGGQGEFANLSESERATRIAQFQAQRSANGGTGGTGATGRTGTGGGVFFGGPDGGGVPGANAQPNAQRTPNPNQSFRRNSGGMNFLFADAVIKLLQQKAGG